MNYLAQSVSGWITNDASEHGPVDPLTGEPATATIDRPDYAKRWQVLLHNDEFHTFEFVILLIMELFGHSLESAVQLTYTVHQEGRAAVATCSKERAELYLEQVASKHERHGEHDLGPLDASIEPVD